MTDKLLSLAREVGAHIGKKTTIERGVEPYIFITESQLTAFAERIRQNERERAAQVCDMRAILNAEARRQLDGSEIIPTCIIDGHVAEAGSCAAAIRSSGTSGSKSDE